MRTPVFYATLTIEILIGLSLILSYSLPRFRVWPPPSRRSWQFWFIWILVDLSYFGFAAAGILDRNSFIFIDRLRIPVGIAFIFLGITLAVWGLRTLSYQTSLGLEGNLIRSGPYRYTRNPQYIGFIGIIAGYSVLANSWMTWIIGLIGALLFAFTPFVEEPWLVERFGEEYKGYMRSVPRFFGRPKYRDADQPPADGEIPHTSRLKG